MTGKKILLTDVPTSGII